MAITYTVEQIQNAYKKSSSRIQKILDGEWVAIVATQIGKETNLRIDKVDNLIKIIGLTLLNIVSLSNFVKVVEEELVIDNSKALEVTKKVDELIFQKVRSISLEEDDENLKEEIYQDGVNNLIEEIKDESEDNLSFKEKFNKVIVKKTEERIVDPYREIID